MRKKKIRKKYLAIDQSSRLYKDISPYKGVGTDCGIMARIRATSYIELANRCPANRSIQTTHPYNLGQGTI